MNGNEFLFMDARKRKEIAFSVQEGFPETSWWTDYQNFYANARLEQSRITRSRFGRIDYLTSGRAETPPRKKDSIYGEED